MGPRVNDLVGAVRAQLRRRVVNQLGGELPSAHIARDGDDGWFGPGSVAWRVHNDPALLIGGIAALLVQTLHPLAMAGVAAHSSYATDPWGRLQRTSRFIADVVYGDSETAAHATQAVTRIHTRVVGTTADGRPYAASDPALLLFVHATEVLLFLRAYQRYGGGCLTTAECDTYVAEMSLIAHALGSSPAPQTVAELEACLASYTPHLACTVVSRDAVRFLRNVDLQPGASLAYGATFDAACALADAAHLDLLGLRAQARRGAASGAGVVIAGVLRWILGPSPVAVAASERVGDVQDEPGTVVPR